MVRFILARPHPGSAVANMAVLRVKADRSPFPASSFEVAPSLIAPPGFGRTDHPRSKFEASWAICMDTPLEA